MTAEKAYLKGDKYCTHPIHYGKLAMFLKYPAKTIKGIKVSGMAAPTAFSSFAKMPISNPKEFPQRPVKTAIR